MCSQTSPFKFAKPDQAPVMRWNDILPSLVFGRMSGLGVSILSSHTLAFGGSDGLVKLDVQQLPIKTKWYLA